MKYYIRRDPAKIAREVCKKMELITIPYPLLRRDCCMRKCVTNKKKLSKKTNIFQIKWDGFYLP